MSNSSTVISSNISAGIRSGNSDTMAADLRNILNDILSSYMNLIDGGFLQVAEAGYSTNVSLTDPRAFAHVGYVQSMAGIPLSGTTPGNPLTGTVEVNNSIITALRSINGDDVSDISTNGSFSGLAAQNSVNNTVAVINAYSNGVFELGGTNGVNGFSFSSDYTNNRLYVIATGAFKGIVYDSDYSANYTSNSLVQKTYVDNNFVPVSFTVSNFNTTVNNQGTRLLVTSNNTSTGDVSTQDLRPNRYRFTSLVNSGDRGANITGLSGSVTIDTFINSAGVLGTYLFSGGLLDFYTEDATNSTSAYIQADAVGTIALQIVGANSVGVSVKSLGGLVGDAYYSTLYTNFSFVQKKYVDDSIAAIPAAPTYTAAPGGGLQLSSNAFSIANNGVTTARILNGAVDLTTKVSGILPVTLGGTGVSITGSAPYRIAILNNTSNGFTFAPTQTPASFAYYDSNGVPVSSGILKNRTSALTSTDLPSIQSNNGDATVFVLIGDASSDIAAFSLESNGGSNFTNIYTDFVQGVLNLDSSIVSTMLSFDINTGIANFNYGVVSQSYIQAQGFKVPFGTSSSFLKADGSVDNSNYLTTSSAVSTYVPYTGATANVNIGSFTLTSSGVSTGTFEMSTALSSFTNPFYIRGVAGTPADAAIYSASSAPSSTNFSLRFQAAGGTVLNSQTGTSIAVGGTNKLVVGNSTFVFSNLTALSSGASTTFSFTKPNHTNQTASTSIPGWQHTSGSRQWATGNISIQIENDWKAATYSFVGNSIITDAYGNYFNAPIAGTNAIFTRTWAAGFGGNIQATGFFKTGGLSTEFLKADGSVDTNTYLTTSSAASIYVPYSGANTSLDMGNQPVYSNGGSQFAAIAGRTNNLSLSSKLTSGSVIIGVNNGLTPIATFDSTGMNMSSYQLVANTFIKSGGTSSQFLKANGSVDSSIYIPVVYKDGTDSSLTGVTTESIIKFILIPANTFNAGDRVKVEVKGRRAASGTGTTVIRLRTNTANSLTSPTPTLCGQYSAASGGLYFPFERSGIVKNQTNNTEYFNTGINTIISDSSAGSTSAVSTVVIDWSVSQYILITLQNSVAGDTSFVSYFSVTKI